MAKRNDAIINIARNITGKMLTGNTAKETAKIMNYFNNQMYGG